MTLLGEVALWMALPLALWGAVLGFYGGRTGRGDLVRSAERSVYAVFFLLVLSSLGIVDAFLNDRFEYWYVANYSNRELDTFFKVAGLWAGQRGSLVFWAVILAFFSAICVWVNRRKNRELMPHVVGVLLTVISFFLVVLLFADVNPFEKLAFVPADGRGLNPQLQNYWMTIHPPTLYLGFTSFAIPFAFGIASLLSGRLDSRWVLVTRRWTLASWFFLSMGIVFGMRWAYEELGWGGYWFWDPVENASLLPWLTATAFLHSIQIQENRGMLKVWNMSLVVLTFLMTIFATFLTRSGLIESVHSFAQNTKIAFIFLGFMGVVMAISAVLILWRLPELKSERQIESFLSREAAFLFNNLILLGAAFAVMWGTLFPLLTEGLLGQKISVGPPFFNRVNVPIGLILLALAGIGPVIAWRRASGRNLMRNFFLPVGVGCATAALLFTLGVRHGYALLTFAIAAFVLCIVAVEFWKGTRSRVRIRDEGWFQALAGLVGQNRRRWGGYIVHVGMVVMFVAFAGAAFDNELRQTVDPGETIVISSAFGHSYALTYEGLSSSQEPNLYRWTALVRVEREGRPLGTLTAERQQFFAPDQQGNTVGIHSSPVEDLYLILYSVEDMEGALRNEPGAERATFEVQVNPLVPWIWIGAFVLALGAMIALWPGGRGIPRRGPSEASRGTPREASEKGSPESDPERVPAGSGTG